MINTRRAFLRWSGRMLPLGLLTMPVFQTAASIAEGLANVRDFGAAGDGVADDSIAFQAAIDSGASEIIVPSGTYCIRKVIDVANRQNITLRGVDKPILFLPPGSDHSNPEAVSIFRFTACNGITIVGFAVNGNRTAYAELNTAFANSDNFRFAWIVACKNVAIRENLFEDWQGVVVKVAALGAAGGSSKSEIRSDAKLSGVNHLRVEDNTFISCGTPCQVNPSVSYDIYLQRNLVYNTDYSAFTIYPHAYNIFVRENIMHGVGQVTSGVYASDGYGVRVYEGAYGEISSNQMLGCDWGIVLLYNDIDFACHDFKIESNQIIDSSAHVSQNGGGICLTGDNIYISGNTISETSDSPKYIGVELEGHNIRFEGNILEYTPSAAGLSFRVGYDALHGIGHYSSSNITICNNRIRVTKGYYAIVVNPSSPIEGIVIEDNDISGMNGPDVFNKHGVAQ